jgi:acyl-CoA synthetase (AMP-forming)/AMP-acid ligase II
VKLKEVFLPHPFYHVSGLLLGMIRIFSGTDMIKIWNWFKAIGSFVRKIKEKNTSADLSF